MLTALMPLGWWLVTTLRDLADGLQDLLEVVDPGHCGPWPVTGDSARPVTAS